MKKKFTNEEVGEIIGRLADKIRSDMDYDFRVALSQMQHAEKDLASTLNENQLELYKDFCEKRAKFEEIAESLYERKF